MFKFFFKRENKKNFKLIFNTMKNHLKEMLREQNVCIELKKIRQQVSDNQRAYYWAIILPAIKKGLYALGNDHYKELEEIHIFMKNQVGFHENCVIVLRHGVVQSKKYKSLSNGKGDRLEVNYYIDECIRWAADNLSIAIPAAGEYGYRNEK